jgi:hypothetical protein
MYFFELPIQVDVGSCGRLDLDDFSVFKAKLQGRVSERLAA